MEISLKLLETQELKFAELKKQITNELNLQALSDDEIEESLKALIQIETEAFDNSMNDLVLRKYYCYFIDNIFPLIYAMITSHKTPQNHLKYFELKKKINEKNRVLLKKSFDDYFYKVGNGFIVNTLNSHEVHMVDELEEIWQKKDLFMVDHNYDDSIATKYPEPKFDYDLNFWVLYAADIQKKLFLIEQSLAEKIPDFASSLALYEHHLKLYLEYVKKYRFISACKQIKEMRSVK